MSETIRKVLFINCVVKIQVLQNVILVQLLMLIGGRANIKMSVIISIIKHTTVMYINLLEKMDQKDL